MSRAAGLRRTPKQRRPPIGAHPAVQCRLARQRDAGAAAERLPLRDQSCHTSAMTQVPMAK